MSSPALQRSITMSLSGHFEGLTFWFAYFVEDDTVGKNPNVSDLPEGFRTVHMFLGQVGGETKIFADGDWRPHDSVFVVGDISFDFEVPKDIFFVARFRQLGILPTDRLVLLDAAETKIVLDAPETDWSLGSEFFDSPEGAQWKELYVEQELNPSPDRRRLKAIMAKAWASDWPGHRR